MNATLLRFRYRVFSCFFVLFWFFCVAFSSGFSFLFVCFTHAVLVLSSLFFFSLSFPFVLLIFSLCVFPHIMCTYTLNVLNDAAYIILYFVCLFVCLSPQNRNKHSNLKTKQILGPKRLPILQINGPHASPTQHLGEYDHVLVIGEGNPIDSYIYIILY